MATVLLVRHATTASTGKRLGGWTPGVHLDDRGRRQAQATARWLSGAKVRAVYTSPLERTLETARAVASVHGLRPRVRAGLGEVDYGTWTDKPLSQLRRRKLWTVVQQAPSRVTFPEGESIRGAQHRAVETIETLVREHRGDDLLVAVSHADVIKALVAHFIGLPLDEFQRLVVSPASVTTLHLPADGPAGLVGFNVTPPPEDDA